MRGETPYLFVENPARRIKHLALELSMTFYQEPEGYIKTILSDLQGAWENLRQVVADNHPFSASDRLLFHIDEGMSWESVRNLAQMHRTLLIIRNLAHTNEAPAEVMKWLQIVSDTLKDIQDRGVN